MTTDTRRKVRTPNIGTGVSEERDRVDFPALRRQRTDRFFDWMDHARIDACVLGREANVRYLTGARRLWTSLSRPFAPTCVASAPTRSVHMLSFSASYEGIPEELAPDDVYAVTWNPMNLVDHVRAVPGLDSARRIGVDALNGLFDGLFRATFPEAELVGVQPDLLDVRRTKSEAEIECLRIAAATAESALMAAVALVRPGRSPKELQAAYLARMSVLGTSQFAQQGTFATWGDDGSFTFDTGTDPLPDGAAVALAGGVLWSGYEGSLARTWWCGRGEPPTALRHLHTRYAELLETVRGAARPGASGTELLAHLTAAGADPDHSAVYFLGMGHEGPLAAAWLDPGALDRQRVVAPGVVALRALLPGGYLAEDMIVVDTHDTSVLTTLGYGPIARR